jgi:negative regulator of flagellin synthesis FlgM
MTDAINTQNRPRSTTTSLDTKGSSSQKADTNTSAQASSSSVVDIKSTKILEAMSTEIDKLPDMDMEKIDSIKQAIANGDYQPNAEVIAQKFTEIERLL